MYKYKYPLHAFSLNYWYPLHHAPIELSFELSTRTAIPYKLSYQIKPRLQLRSEKQSSHQGEKTTLDGTTETREIRLKIHPLEIEEKDSEISDGFRSKNPPRIDLEQNHKNKKNRTATHPLG